jgi:hypothetical protein
MTYYDYDVASFSPTITQAQTLYDHLLARLKLKNSFCNITEAQNALLEQNILKEITVN